jgi:DNA-binding NarL/FixJ family response regulator
MNDSAILLVEDDAELRQAMRDWLAPLFPEWTFEETNCAEAAMGIVVLRPPALVLMDFKLPGLNGIEATRRLKVNAPALPVVIVTVYEDAAYRADAEAAGAAGYICKRRMHADLVPLLRRLLSGALREMPGENEQPGEEPPGR